MERFIQRETYPRDDCYRISKHHKVGTSLQRGAFFFIPAEPQSDYSKFIYGSCLSMPFALFV